MKEKATEKLANPARRQLLLGKQPDSPQLRLPWVTDEANFLEHCTQCEECVKVCETNIIQHDQAGYPYINFQHDECTFCQQCIDVCDQTFFLPALERDSTKPWSMKLVITDQCFALNHIFCQSCQDVCEPQAIRFYYKNAGTPAPNLATDQCHQCGACVSVCPSNAIQHLFYS
ncbi:ferredoxin-type protein NapF [Marinomonas agarivorans]|nr:ferredoxin-type protein NapF [Marinomonas agarivorans]